MPKKSSEARMNFWRKAREGTGREMFKEEAGIGKAQRTEGQSQSEEECRGK